MGQTAPTGRGDRAPTPLPSRPAVGRALLVAAVLAVAAVAGWTRLASPRLSREILVAAQGMAFSATELEARAGEIELVFANTDAVTHTFTIESLEVDLVVSAGGARAAVFETQPGHYPFQCTVPGHDVPGMRGVLQVR